MPNKIDGNILVESKHTTGSKGIVSSKIKFKYGIIELNDVKITISASDNVEKIAKKVNAKKHLTQISAELISTKGGFKLLLKSKNKIVKLNDPYGALASLFKDRTIGTNDNSVIQFVRNFPGQKSQNLIINYTKIDNNRNKANNSYLHETMKLYLSRKYDTNNCVPFAEVEVDAAPIEPEEGAHEVIIPGHEVDAAPIEPEEGAHEVIIPGHDINGQKWSRLAISRAFTKLAETILFESDEVKAQLLDRFSTALFNNPNYSAEVLKAKVINRSIENPIYNKLNANRPSASWWNPFSHAPTTYNLSIIKQNEIANWLQNIAI